MSGLLPRAADVPLLRRIWELLPEARLVGGAVRDLMCGQVAVDIDLATPEPPDAVSRILGRAGIKVVPTGISHGTVTAVLDGKPVEITTLRRDVQTDGRHAVVDWTTDWREDASRRDFTINAMSLDRHDALHDFFGGVEDPSTGTVRFVGDPAVRLAEDALRALRFFRFHARFGRGTPDPTALAAIGAVVGRLGHLSAERVWSELKRLLTGPTPVGAVRLMCDTGVLRALLEGGTDPERFARLVGLGAPADTMLRLAAVAIGPTDAIAGSLRLSRAEAAAFASVRRAPVPEPDAEDDDLRRMLAAEPASDLIRRCWLFEADRGVATDHARWNGLRWRLQATARPVFPLGGADAVAIGIRPGPAVGRALRAVSEWWCAGGCRADRQSCLSRLRVELDGGGQN